MFSFGSCAGSTDRNLIPKTLETEGYWQMSLHEEKNLAERLDDAEASVREAVQWLKDGGSLDDEAESSANDAIQTIVMLRRACD